jgi:RHS repeat-associated protein
MNSPTQRVQSVASQHFSRSAVARKVECPLFRPRGGVESQFHYDAQGSTLAVTDDNQNVTDTFAYSAFGEVTERTGTTEVPFQYIGRQGYYTDGLSGQIMVRERPYEPARARWPVVDPRSAIRIASTKAGAYVYADNNPNQNVDPSGLISIRIDNMEGVKLEPCGGYKVVWKHQASNARHLGEPAWNTVVYIQHICVYMALRFQTCYEDDCGCHRMPETAHKGCCYYELIGAKDRIGPGGLYGVATDTNSLPPLVRAGHPCTSRGSYFTGVGMRAFVANRDVVLEIKKWRTGGKCNVDGIRELDVRLGLSTTEKPGFWDKEELIADRGAHGTIVKWNCCDMFGGKTGSVEFGTCSDESFANIEHIACITYDEYGRPQIQTFDGACTER